VYVDFCNKSVGGVLLSHQASANRSAWNSQLFSGCIATDLNTVKMAYVVIIRVDEPSLRLFYRQVSHQQQGCYEHKLLPGNCRDIPETQHDTTDRISALNLHFFGV